MYPESGSTTARAGQQGAGLPLAIFLITVMALIVATIAQLQQTSGETAALDILSGRAFYAAESGAQLAMTEVLPDEDSLVCPLDRDYGFTRSGLRGCEAQVTVVCEGDEPIARITSVGRCGSGPDRASRRVEVKVQ
ncbi:MAG: hypothetical protein R3296_07460 [Oleiphilaceae bacterium]|nr:hypothetical protein [Oleiphilaceae bacterium]